MLNIENKEELRKKLQENTCIHTLDGSGCWEFLGHLTHGYGEIRIGNRYYRVSRLGLYIFKDFDLNSPLWALHKLECKRKSCWNPEHLYLGNGTQNQLDTVILKTHSKSKKTHCLRGHELNDKNTYYYQTSRKCKICHEIRRKNFRKEEALRIYNKLKSL